VTGNVGGELTEVSEKELNKGFRATFWACFASMIFVVLVSLVGMMRAGKMGLKWSKVIEIADRLLGYDKCYRAFSYHNQIVTTGFLTACKVSALMRLRVSPLRVESTFIKVFLIILIPPSGETCPR